MRKEIKESSEKAKMEKINKYKQIQKEKQEFNIIKNDASMTTTINGMQVVSSFDGFNLIYMVMMIAIFFKKGEI